MSKSIKIRKDYYEIPIRGKKVIGIPKTIEIDKIEFDEINPRISMSRDSFLMGGTKKINQDMISFFLKSLPSYNELKITIKHSGGAMQPIWVYPISKDKYKVIEGNTRLLIYKELREEEGKYDKINCILLPSEIDEEIKDFVRLTCHLRGHTEWDTYERAKYLHKLYHEERYPVKELAKLTKLSAISILQDIEAYNIMTNQFYKEYGTSDNVHKFSYFKEFVKNKKLKILMKELKLDENNFCDWVGKKKLDRAMDVRKLYNILKETASRETFLKKDFDRAMDILRDLIPEKSEKIYILMTDLSKKIDKMEFADFEEIGIPSSKKRKVVTELDEKLRKLLGHK